MIRIFMVILALATFLQGFAGGVARADTTVVTLEFLSLSQDDQSSKTQDDVTDLHCCSDEDEGKTTAPNSSCTTDCKFLTNTMTFAVKRHASEHSFSGILWTLMSRSFIDLRPPIA